MDHLRIGVLVACLAILPTMVHGQDKYALLIAVTKYEHSAMNQPEPLKYPEEDAKSLGEILKSNGYEVELLLGEAAMRQTIVTKLEGLTKKADAEGLVLVGLFGHGVEIETFDEQRNAAMMGCFCPYDTAVRIAKDVNGNVIFDKSKQPVTEPDPVTLVKLSDVMVSLKLAKAGNRVVLADCCRTVPNQARGRSFGAGFRAQDLPANTSVMFGCSPNERAFEHDEWGHGAFTQCLLESMTDLSVSGTVETANLAVQLKRRVPQLVASISPGDRQTPKLFSTDSVDLKLARVELKNLRRTSMTKANRPTEANTTGLTYPGKSGGTRAGESKSLVPGINFRWCPPGKFHMGKTKSEIIKGLKANPNQESVEVTLTQGFWLSETEVTQGQWQQVMKTSPWRGKPQVRVGDNFPASYLSYNDAVAFCEKLTSSEKAANRLEAGWYFVLPSEAQWEYACRSGTNQKFGFGDDDGKLGDYAWFESSVKKAGEEYAHRVAQKKPNNWGLYDMHGNILEWCSDLYSEQLPGGEDPVVEESGSRRVVRGGSWTTVAASCRASVRSHRAPDKDFRDSGFRLAVVFIAEAP